MTAAIMAIKPRAGCLAQKQSSVLMHMRARRSLLHANIRRSYRRRVAAKETHNKPLAVTSKSIFLF